MTLQPILDGEKEKGGAMPLRGRSGVPSGLSPVSRSQPKAPAAIAGPSEGFVGLTRNPKLRPPVRFEPTSKQPGDIVL